MIRILLPLLLLAGTSAGAQVKEKKIRQFAGTIRAGELKQKLSVIASAEMEGRGTATEGQRKAAAYIEAQFRGIGLLPGNGGSFQQAFNVYQDSLLDAKLAAGDTRLQWNEDFTVNLSASANLKKTFEGIVFAGYGISDSAYDDLQHLDIKDRVVLIIEGEPRRTDGKYVISGSDRPSQRWANPNARIHNLRRKGAAVILFYQKTMRGPGSSRGNMYFRPSQQEGAVITLLPAGLRKLVGKEDAEEVAGIAASNGKPGVRTWPAALQVEVSKQVAKAFWLGDCIQVV